MIEEGSQEDSQHRLIHGVETKELDTRAVRIGKESGKGGIIWKQKKDVRSSSSQKRTAGQEHAKGPQRHGIAICNITGRCPKCRDRNKLDRQVGERFGQGAWCAMRYETILVLRRTLGRQKGISRWRRDRYATREHTNRSLVSGSVLYGRVRRIVAGQSILLGWWLLKCRSLI